MNKSRIFALFIALVVSFGLTACDFSRSETPTQPVEEPTPTVPSNNASVQENDSGIIPTGGQGSASFVVSANTGSPDNEYVKWEFQNGNPPSSPAKQGEVKYADAGTWRWSCEVCNAAGCSDPREGFVTFVDEETADAEGSGF